MENDNLFNSYDRNLYKIGYQTDDAGNAINSAPSSTELAGSETGGGLNPNPQDPESSNSGAMPATVNQPVGNLQSGKTKFDNTETGFILGVDKSVAKFYIGNTTDYLNWTGTQLIVSGNISATTGTIGGWTIGATTISSANIILDSANSEIIIGSSNGIIIDGVNHKITSADGTTWSLNGDGTVTGFSPTIVVLTYLNAGSPATWTKQAGLKYVMVELVGSGAGGGGSNVQHIAGGGGGAGGYSRKLIAAASLGATETVTIPAGGAGGANTGADGSAGGTTSFGSHCSATGGTGGGGSGNGGIAGTGGIGSNGDINSSGSSGVGAGGGISGGGGSTGGSGGTSYFGGGAAGLGADSSPSASQVYGGGGAGYGKNASNGAGSAGSAGIVIVTEYY